MFITFEGCDGCGKSTQIARAKAYLEQRGKRVIVTREPGGTRLSERLRELILDPTLAMTPAAEALLFAAARAQHADELIRPALAEGGIVLCDRYVDSSVAYQGAARGLGADRVRELFDRTCGLLPDLTIWLDVSARDAFVRKGGATGDRFESEKEAFAKKVYDGYAAICAAEPRRVRRIDASGSKDETAAKVAALLEEVCP